MAKKVIEAVTLVERQGAFMDVYEGGPDDWYKLAEEERRVVGLMVFFRGNVKRVAENMRVAESELHDLLDPVEKPWVWRGIEYYHNNVAELKKDIASEQLLGYLVQDIEKLRHDEKTPPETRRKTGRDLMEAEGWFPKYPTGGSQTNVQINVAIPDWAKKENDA